jgi:ParB-like chromosome segregation protein Spo0J
MKIEQVAIEQLTPAPYNPRTMGEKEFEGLKASLKTFGMVEPVVANKRNNHIVGGHMRAEAWHNLGHDQVPVVWLDLDDHQERKLNILLNSQAISGEYDADKLSELLEEFKTDDDFTALRLDELEPADGSTPTEKVPCPTCGTNVDPSKLQ